MDFEDFEDLDQDLFEDDFECEDTFEDEIEFDEEL